MSDFEALIDGYRRFRLGAYREQRERYDHLAQGQAPAVMVIACSDSRVDPTRVFDSGPGELFVLRNIANLVPPVSAISGQSSVAAAVEYAVTGLKVQHIVVFGHARCGGIQAALAGDFDTIPPMFNAYIGLTETMRMFGSIVDHNFGSVFETGIMVTMADLLDTKRKRYIEPYIEYLKIVIEERKQAKKASREKKLKEKEKLKKQKALKRELKVKK